MVFFRLELNYLNLKKQQKGVEAGKNVVMVKLKLTPIPNQNVLVFVCHALPHLVLVLTHVFLIVMRMETTFTLLLNVAIYPEMVVSQPNKKHVSFYGINAVGNEPVTNNFLVRLVDGDGFASGVKKCQKDLPAPNPTAETKPEEKKEEK